MEKHKKELPKKCIPPWSGNFFKIASAALSPFLYCLVSYDFCSNENKDK
jgi:hypothetical protein